MNSLNKLRKEDPKAYLHQMKEYVDIVEEGKSKELSSKVRKKIKKEGWLNEDTQTIAWASAVQEKSSTEIAEHMLLSSRYIRRVIKRLNLSRDSGYAQHLVKRNTWNVTDRGKEMLIGNLLGDGTIRNVDKPSVDFRTATIQKDYSDFLMKNYAKEGLLTNRCVKSDGETTIKGKTYKVKDAYYIRTKAYKELQDWRGKWYPKGTKIVPKDIELSPLTMLLWYLDDGSNDRNSGLRLWTNAFRKEDICFLVEKLKDTISIKANIQWVRKTQPVIYIPLGFKRRFLLYILPEFSKELEDCFGYKFM